MPRVRKIPKGYLTVKQVSERLGISTVWVYSLIDKMNIPTFKHGITVIREADARKLEVPEPID